MNSIYSIHRRGGRRRQKALRWHFRRDPAIRYAFRQLLLLARIDPELFAIGVLLYAVGLSLERVVGLTLEQLVFREGRAQLIPAPGTAGGPVDVPSWCHADLAALFLAHPGPHLLRGNEAERIAKCEAVRAFVEGEALSL